MLRIISERLWLRDHRVVLVAHVVLSRLPWKARAYLGRLIVDLHFVVVVVFPLYCNWESLRNKWEIMIRTLNYNICLMMRLL